MPDYRVLICKDFEADNPVDAAQFMIEWLTADEGAQHGTYEIEGDEGKFLYNHELEIIMATTDYFRDYGE